MNTFIASAVAVMISVTPVALMTTSASADDAVGRVVGYSDDSRLLRLSNGRTYILPANFDRSGLAEGVSVEIDYVENGQRRVVRDIATY